MKMKIDIDKLSRKIAEGLMESSEDLKSSGLDIVDELEDLSIVARMIEDPTMTECNPRLIELSFSGYDEVYDRIALAHFKRNDLFAIFEARDSEKRSEIVSKITQIDDSNIEVAVKEIFKVSSVKGYGKVYNNGERVDFRRMSSNELADWVCKITQCSTAGELIDGLDYMFLHDLFGFNSEKEAKVVDGYSVKEEFRNMDAREFLEKYADLKSASSHFMPLLVAEKWPFDSIKRGWTKTYKFRVDFSDTIIPIDEDALKRKAIVKDRIVAALKENSPFKANFERFSSSLFETACEMIALDIYDGYSNIDLSQGQFDEETFINALEYEVGSGLERLITDYVFKVIIDVHNSRHDSNNSSVLCMVVIKGKYLDNSVIKVDDRHVPIDHYLELLAEDRNLDLEENYDILKEEVLETFGAEDHFWEITYVKFELDFSDLFED